MWVVEHIACGESASLKSSAGSVLVQVGVSNGVLRGLSGLTKLHTLQIPDAYRVTDAGLQFISTLTGRPLLPSDAACSPGTIAIRRKAL